MPQKAQPFAAGHTVGSVSLALCTADPCPMDRRSSAFCQCMSAFKGSWELSNSLSPRQSLGRLPVSQELRTAAFAKGPFMSWPWMAELGARPVPKRRQAGTREPRRLRCRSGQPPGLA